MKMPPQMGAPAAGHTWPVDLKKTPAKLDFSISKTGTSWSCLSAYSLATIQSRASLLSRRQHEGICAIANLACPCDAWISLILCLRRPGASTRSTATEIWTLFVVSLSDFSFSTRGSVHLNKRCVHSTHACQDFALRYDDESP